MTRSADIIRSTGWYGNLSARDRDYLIDNPDEVAEFIRLEEDDWLLVVLLRPHLCYLIN